MSAAALHTSATPQDTGHAHTAAPRLATAPHLAAAMRNAESLCIKCGFCLPACPTYRETGIEAASPRGRLDLMYGAAQGRVSLEQIAPQLALCLGCQACETACPSGIQYHDMLEAQRIDLADQRRARLSHRFGRMLLSGLLPSPTLLRIAVWKMWAYQRSGLQSLVRATHVLALIPPLNRMERSMPPVSRPVPWRRALQGPAPVPERKRVAMLTGCVMDAAFGEVHAATVHVLRANGIGIVDVPEQTCCGALHLHAGELEGARELAKRNIAAFESVGDVPILLNSAGCGAMLKQLGPLFAGDSGWEARGRRISARVRDITEYLAAEALNPPTGRVERTVAYDEPCHLAHAQKIRDQPRELLAGIPGLKLVPLREADMCCGSAGSYSALQPGMSRRLLQRKMEHIAASGADIVATGNPGCLLQLRLGAQDHEVSVRVVHPIELLAEAYGRPMAQR